MKTSHRQALTRIEKNLISEIRVLRAKRGSGPASASTGGPAPLIRRLIVEVQGNVGLHIAPLASELGVEMRTLERAFLEQFGETMADCQRRVRLESCQRMLSDQPPTKIAAIAADLGYSRVQDFNRFFKKQTGQTPTQWATEYASRRKAGDPSA